MKNPELALVIPVFNEEKVIKQVINKWLKVLKQINFKIIIVNDGSNDNTKKIIKSILTNKIILLNKKNSGHGPTITYGYKAALKLKPKFIFQVDSDNQFSTGDFKKFWKKRQNYDFIIGHRLVRNDPLHRLVITRILKFFIILFFGVSVKDINVPYRLMNFKVLKEGIKCINPRNIVPNILLSLFAFKKFKYKTEIIKHKKRKTGQVVLANWNLIKFCIRAFYEVAMFRFFKFKL